MNYLYLTFSRLERASNPFRRLSNPSPRMLSILISMDISFSILGFFCNIHIIKLSDASRFHFRPLYIYPSLIPSAWEPLYTAAAKCPQLTFNAVGAYPSKNPLNLRHTTNTILSQHRQRSWPQPRKRYKLHHLPSTITPTSTPSATYTSASFPPTPTSDVVAEITQYSTWYPLPTRKDKISLSMGFSLTRLLPIWEITHTCQHSLSLLARTLSPR
jgi:hypothetical protein